MNLRGSRRSAGEGDDDYWPFDQGAGAADAAAAAPPAPPQLPPRRPAGESVLPQPERRVTGERRRQLARRPSSRRPAGAEAAGERRAGAGRRRSDPQEQVRSARAVPSRSGVRGALRSRHATDAGLLLLAVVVAVLVVLALTG